MEKIKRRIFIVLLMLLITAGFIFMDSHLSMKGNRVDLDKLPLRIGGWQGRDFPVAERILRILDTNYILNRDYTDGTGKRVFLSVVYYPDNKIGFHNPESCNTGIGMSVLEKLVVPMQIDGDGGKPKQLDANMLVLGKEGPVRVIYYFYLTGKYMTGNYKKFRWEMMKEQMKLNRPSGAQVQIHIDVRNKDVQETSGVVKDFINKLRPVLLQYL